MFKRKKNTNTTDPAYDHLDVVVSSTDCTGLMPTPPASEAEAEAYAELNHIPKPEKGKDRELQHE